MKLLATRSSAAVCLAGFAGLGYAALQDERGLIAVMSGVAFILGLIFYAALTIRYSQGPDPLTEDGLSYRERPPRSRAVYPMPPSRQNQRTYQPACTAQIDDDDGQTLARSMLGVDIDPTVSAEGDNDPPTDAAVRGVAVQQQTTVDNDSPASGDGASGGSSSSSNDAFPASSPDPGS